MKQQQQFKDVIDMLTTLMDDSTVPRNVKTEIESILSELNSEGDVSLKKDKAFQKLEDIASDPNLQMYTRTEILNILGLLEKH